MAKAKSKVKKSKVKKSKVKKFNSVLDFKADDFKVTGTHIDVDDKLYHKLKPFTQETEDMVDNFRAEYINSVMGKGMEFHGRDIFTKDKSVKQVTMEANIGNHTASAVVSRSSGRGKSKKKGTTTLVIGHNYSQDDDKGSIRRTMAYISDIMQDVE